MKKFLLALVGVAIVMSAGNALYRQNTKRETFQEINLGMGKSEARELLGGVLAMPDRTRHLRTGEDEEIWLGEDGAIIVVFRNDVLCYKEWVEPAAVKYLVGFGAE